MHGTRVEQPGRRSAVGCLEASLRAATFRISPTVAIEKVRYEPAYGALLLAYRELVIDIAELTR